MIKGTIEIRFNDETAVLAFEEYINKRIVGSEKIKIVELVYDDNGICIIIEKAGSTPSRSKK